MEFLLPFNRIPELSTDLKTVFNWIIKKFVSFGAFLERHEERRSHREDEGDASIIV